MFTANRVVGFLEFHTSLLHSTVPQLEDLVDENIQRRNARLAQADKKPTVTQTTMVSKKAS